MCFFRILVFKQTLTKTRLFLVIQYISLVCEYLAISTRGAIDGWSFLGLAEEGIVWVAAPELFTWVKGAILQGTEGALLKTNITARKRSVWPHHQSDSLNDSRLKMKRDENRDSTTTISTTVLYWQKHHPFTESLYTTLYKRHRPFMQTQPGIISTSAHSSD